VVKGKDGAPGNLSGGILLEKCVIVRSVIVVLFRVDAPNASFIQHSSVVVVVVAVAATAIPVTVE
jgi:hypothetical protein